MFLKKQRIVIFGAGIGGQHALRCLRHRCKILAFADNDTKKHGKRMLGRPIVNPAALKSMAFDKVYIASMYAPQISIQLLEQLQIDPTKVETVRRDIIEGEYEVSPWSIVVLIFMGVLGLVLLLSAAWFARRWLGLEYIG